MYLVLQTLNLYSSCDKKHFTVVTLLWSYVEPTSRYYTAHIIHITVSFFNNKLYRNMIRVKATYLIILRHVPVFTGRASFKKFTESYI